VFISRNETQKLDYHIMIIVVFGIY